MLRDKSAINVIRVSVMGVATYLEYIFGGYDGVFITLVVFMSIDYLTGVISAYINRTLSSRIGAFGIIKKVGILSIIALTAIMDRNIFSSQTLRDAVILYYISNEGISIVENACKLGVPIPEKLKGVLKSINEDIKSIETKDE